MISIYIIIFFLILALATTNLLVGISNDVSSFLANASIHSSIPLKKLLLWAGIGIVIGSLLSHNMAPVPYMQVLNPTSFNLSNILTIVLTVMISDIILLELFNTYGLPSSTTVSLIFEILGASLGIAFLSLRSSHVGLNNIGLYINAPGSFAIISSLLLSVMLAFLSGFVLHYFIRFLFSFQIERSFIYWGALFESIACSFIFYQLTIKTGIYQSVVSSNIASWIADNTGSYMLYTCIILFIVFQLANSYSTSFGYKLMMCCGALLLALCFASNGLACFTGIIVAGFSAISDIILHPGQLATSPQFFSIAKYSEILFSFGVGMVVAGSLWFGQKAKNKSNHSYVFSKNYENPESAYMARIVVRKTFAIKQTLTQLMPNSWILLLQKRFEKKEQASNDYISSATVLFLSAMIISFATSNFLPVSTTYVSFMVALGVSISDRVWNRNNAVINLSRMITTIGSWFFSALCIFTIAFFIAIILTIGKVIALLLLAALSIFLIYRTIRLKKQELEIDVEDEKSLTADFSSLTQLYQSVAVNLAKYQLSYSKNYYLSIKSVILTFRINEKVAENINTLHKELSNWKYEAIRQVNNLSDEAIDIGHAYLQAIDECEETQQCLNNINQSICEFFNSNPTTQLSDQSRKDLSDISEDAAEYLNLALHIMKSKRIIAEDELLVRLHAIKEVCEKLKKKQLKQVRKGETGSRCSLLFLDLLTETYDMCFSVFQSIEALQNMQRTIQPKHRKSV
jgi:hypothetical protein